MYVEEIEINKLAQYKENRMYQSIIIKTLRKEINMLLFYLNDFNLTLTRQNSKGLSSLLQKKLRSEF